ncbi:MULTISPECIES: RidA family protein [Nocardiopsidaceae]|jgi:enamine deaminase RidA (YjgF/YER057c/UK114 family)|uniref:RidA family protein n=2 Tax=Nocardiopsidaceae TaxID=83676 RepID=A0ABY6YH66_9ACTN|nr:MULTISPECIES: RidA family protein [Nocardiopsaceae]MEE2051160.1 RidA family protein [Nocardiopsis umidischolae]WAE71610.1 RidA family protein [Streptomonospora nanhaiensis]
MDRTPHEIVNPLSLADPVGYSHALVVRPGRLVRVGGQTSRRPDGKVVGDSVAQQFDQALANLVEALRAAGAEPAHVVDMCVYTTSMHSYRVNSGTIGSVYRRHMGRYYPPMTAVGVTDLMDPDALVALTCTAVIPEDAADDLLHRAEARELVEEAEETLAADPLAARDPGVRPGRTRP